MTEPTPHPWLDDSLACANDFVDILKRAYSVACGPEPVTAMVIFPLIGQAREIEQRLSELIAARREQQL